MQIIIISWYNKFTIVILFKIKAGIPEPLNLGPLSIHNISCLWITTAFFNVNLSIL